MEGLCVFHLSLCLIIVCILGQLWASSSRCYPSLWQTHNCSAQHKERDPLMCFVKAISLEIMETCLSILWNVIYGQPTGRPYFVALLTTGTVWLRNMIWYLCLKKKSIRKVLFLISCSWTFKGLMMWCSFSCSIYSFFFFVYIFDKMWNLYLWWKQQNEFNCKPCNGLLILQPTLTL